jgi:hypothetical protein
MEDMSEIVSLALSGNADRLTGADAVVVQKTVSTADGGDGNLANC